MITLPIIKPPNPTKPLPPNFKSNAYCHYHRQNGHETKNCKHFKHLVQDLIDYGRLSIAGVNDHINKFVSPPNQNLQIFTNPMPKYNFLFVKASETLKNFVMNVHTKHPNPIPHITTINPMDEKVGVIDVIPHKGQPKKSLDITFSSKDILTNLPDGPLYMVRCIYD